MSSVSLSSSTTNFGLLVRHAGRPFTRILQDQISTFGISAGEYRVMRAIEEGPAMQAAIGQRAAMDRPFVTTLVKKLTDKKLVAGVRNRQDRRRMDLRLTAAGRRLLTRIQTKIIEPINGASVTGIDAEELAVFESVARRMIANLEATFPIVSVGVNS